MKKFLLLFLLCCYQVKAHIPLEKVTDTKLLNLVREAGKALKKAHIPKGRNNYRVGAALLAQDGHIYKGSNVKIPCGLDVCAERVALYVALQQAPSPLHIQAIAIDTPQKKRISPCGVCREALNYFAGPDTLIIFRNDEGEVVSTPFSNLLPLPFKSASPK